MDKNYIKAKLANIPHLPGSYQMKNKYNEIIYVGKAKDLHNRVNQYFTGSHDFKTTKLVSNIEDFDFIVTKTEKEALVLEINLIKKYRPKYNIQFIDDSSYPYIKLTKEKYPRISIARDMKKDKKAKYFGPFPDAGAAKNTLKLLQTLYPFRRCNKMHDKVCLYYHMGQCLGPCQFEIDDNVYKDYTNAVTKFLNGDTKDVRLSLENNMMKESENLNFEKAQEYKILIESIDKIVNDKQNIEIDHRGNRDVFAYYVDRGYISITGFLVRNGTILNKEFKIRPLYGDGEDEFISFIIQYYQDHPSARELVLPLDVDIEALKEVLDFKIFQPQKGYKNHLIKMCIENAKRQLNLKFDTVEKQSEKTELAVEELSHLANHPMNRVELFDNSHISGSFTVASCVVYEDGIPDKNSYRLYKLHTKNSDIDSMKEVTYRRYFRLLKDDGRLPDGILVDGGFIQIQATKEILDSLGLSDRIKLMGLVKDDHHNTNALMDTDGSIIPIDKNSTLFFLLTRMQDEVHRVAINYHRKLRSKAQTKSILDEIEGVGPKRKKMLLKTFKNFTNIKNASIDELKNVLPDEVANNVFEALNKRNDE